MHLPGQIREAIVAHARWAYPYEACGLLALDVDDGLRMAYCLTNIEASSHRFTVDPTEHFGAMRHAEANGWRIAGSFHSHPHSAAEPSRADIDGALDSTWLYVIAGPVGDEVPVRAYRIEAAGAAEIPLDVDVAA